MRITPTHWLLSRTGQSTLTSTPLSELPTGLLYGYSVYTSFKLPISKKWLTAHIERLQHDACAMNLDFSVSQAEIIQFFSEESNTCPPQVVRLSLIPDIASYPEFFETSANARIPSLLIRSNRPVPSAFLSAFAPGGIRLKSVPLQRAFATIKTGAMIEIIHYKRQALREGFEDIVLINQAGNLSEASTANLFCIQNGRLLTPAPQRDYCLPGITRQQVLEIAKDKGISASESEPIALSSIKKIDNKIDGLFLSNAVQGVFPVHSIDDIRFPWLAEASDILATLAQAVNDILPSSTNRVPS